MRIDGRRADELREIRLTRNYTKHAAGSVLVEMGDTHVLCSAMIEERVPPFLVNSGQGWLTAEYGMLPSSTGTRKIREERRGRTDGRSMEIQRLIGRCLRTVVEMRAFPNLTIWIDCDVIQADGGTRTAAINGGFVALVDCLDRLKKAGLTRGEPLRGGVGAVSVGVVDGEPILDLCYGEDSRADTDMNLVMTSDGRYIEVQGSAEKTPFGADQLARMLELGQAGIRHILELQSASLATA
jgi:ribonuclease PH